MVNQEILGGLRHALNKGESLEKAMLSFYNAGYRKEEIEETARFIQQKESPAPIAQETKLIPTQINSQSKISSYGQEKLKKSNPIKKTAKGLIIAIIVAAIIFVGLLIAFLIAA
ncbi:hypothetical protein HYT91_01330 [Candidatus Pacearchaeota archaeon]|nr:hypothetical protein [Candidatus Pacearchaeota archaeon]